MQPETKKRNVGSGSGSGGSVAVCFFFAVSLVPDILSGGRAVTRLATAHTCPWPCGAAARRGDE